MKKLDIKQKAQLALGLDVVTFIATLILFIHTANTVFMFLLSLVLAVISLDMIQAYKFLKYFKGRR
jgi:ABC-type antimicrobial peptide transport system permease subunit